MKTDFNIKASCIDNAFYGKCQQIVNNWMIDGSFKLCGLFVREVNIYDDFASFYDYYYNTKNKKCYQHVFSLFKNGKVINSH